MAELKNIRIAVSGIYDYALEELPTLRLPMPGRGAPDWVEEKRLYKVYRPASVLAVACPKFANLPMTHHHPKTPVDGQNFRDLAIGWTGEHPEVDYIAETNEVGIKSTCMLYDDEALQAYQNGEIQLSPGYIADFEWQKGTTPDGREYDIIMKEITDVNHLALLPNGRGGEYAVVMDQAPERKTVFEIAMNRREVLDYGSIFDIARSLTEDVTFEEGHISHRKDGDYVKQGGEWKPVDNKKKNSDNERMEKEVNPFFNNQKTWKLEAEGKTKLINELDNVKISSKSSIDEDFNTLRKVGLMNRNLVKGYMREKGPEDNKGYEIKTRILQELAPVYKEKGGIVKKDSDGGVLYFYSPDGRQISFHGNFKNLDVPEADYREWNGIENSFLAESKEEEEKLKAEQDLKKEKLKALIMKFTNIVKKDVGVKNFLRKKGLEEKDLNNISPDFNERDSDDLDMRYQRIMSTPVYSVSYLGLPRMNYKDQQELTAKLNRAYEKNAEKIYTPQEYEIYKKNNS